MSDTPEVKLPVTCSRTNKPIEIKLPLTDVEKFLATQRAREANVAKIEEFFSGMNQEEIPHLVAFYKGKLVVLPTVLNKNDAAVLRMFHEATQSDVFPKPVPRKRNKKDTETIGDEGTEGVETSAEASKAAKAAKKKGAAGKSSSDPASAPAS